MQLDILQSNIVVSTYYCMCRLGDKEPVVTSSAMSLFFLILFYFNPQLMELDVASLESVRSFAKKIDAKNSLLHLLVNNAGVFTMFGTLFPVLLLRSLFLAGYCALDAYYHTMFYTDS